MSEYLQRDAGLWISKTRESAFNTPETTGSNFLRATSTNAQVLIPEMEKTDDANRVGNASEFPTTQCNQYWLPPALSISDQANFALFLRLALRAVGGSVANANVAGAAYSHIANMLPKISGLQLPASTIVSELGGASFLFAGNVIERFRMSQEGVQPVICQFDFLGSGKHRSPHQIGTRQVETATAAGTITGDGNATVVVTSAILPGSPITVSVAVLENDTAADWAAKVRAALTAHAVISAFYIVGGSTTAISLTARNTAANDTTLNISLDNGTCTGITAAPTSANTTAGAFTLPDVPSFSCVKPKSFLEYTDDSGLVDLTTACRVRSWFVEIVNNHNPTDDRCIGDSTQDAGDYTASGGDSDAAYLSKLTRGDRVVNAQIVILLDATMPEWLQMAENTPLTDIKFGARGAVLDVGGPTYEELSVIIPNGVFSAVQEQDSNGKAALVLTFKAMYDSTAIGAQIYSVNDEATVV